jgi:MFS family permease
VVALVGTVLFLPESLPIESRRPFGAAPAIASTRQRGSAPWSILAAKPVLVGLVVSSLTVAIAAGALQSVYPFWGRDLFGFSLEDVGLHFMAFALLSAIGQAGLTGPLTRRFGERRLAVGALAGVTVGLMLFSVASSPAIAWLAICVFGFANGLFLPAISSLMSFEAEDDERGAVMGVFNASSSAGRILGPALSGPIYFKFGPAAPFVLSAMLTVLGALLMARRERR